MQFLPEATTIAQALIRNGRSCRFGFNGSLVLRDTSTCRFFSRGGDDESIYPNEERERTSDNIEIKLKLYLYNILVFLKVIEDPRRN